MAEDGDSIDRAAVFFAVKEMAAHPSVASISETVFGAGRATVMVTVKVRLGRRARVQGGSVNGVNAQEEVRIDFPPGFPARSAAASLRPDFSRNHPHIQPVLIEGRVVPCLVDGKLDEFVASRGFYGLIDQVALWLENAASGTLMDPEQGWEPTRRDGYPDMLIADADALRALVDRQGGFRFFKTGYLFGKSDDFTPFFFGALGEPTNVQASISEWTARKDNKLGHGEGLAIVSWAGSRPDGKKIVCGEYLPDDFRTVGDLLERLDAYGTRPRIEAALELVRRRAALEKRSSVFPLVIINLVRRPYHLIGSNSDIEICGYVVPLRTPSGALANPDDPIRPLAHRDALKPGLLRTVSGERETDSWALLGCGSLGSKIAMHAGRSGNAPGIVADRAMLGPHNAARHALYPPASEMQFGWLGGKADALGVALEGLGAKVRALGDDHLALARELIATKDATRPRWLVNTTASMVVQESLCQPGMHELPRVVEMALFDGGKLGTIYIEGPDRNPNTVELEASFFQHAAATPAIGRHLFHPDETAGQVEIGQGCGSLTIKMSDAALSTMAGPMQEIFTDLTVEEPSAIHTLRREGFGLAHDRIEVPAFRRVDIDGMDGWRMSVAEDVYRRIVDESAAYPNAETGGILIGWSSMIARQIIVTALIAAPADSVRTKTKFELGVEGVAAELAQVLDQSGGMLRLVGTWHSHLGSAEPSGIDRNSAALVGAGYLQPMAFLVFGTDGLRAVSMPARLVVLEEKPEAERRA